MRYLVTGKNAADIDRYTVEKAGVPQLVLMERAALAVAEKTAELLRDSRNDRILVVAESGNNGGDGVAAARILHQRGYEVSVWALNGISKQSDAYIKQKDLAVKAGVAFEEHFSAEKTGKTDVNEDPLKDYSIIIDAIFGVGLTREVVGIQKSAVECINHWRNKKEGDAGRIVISVDIPSGISSETGEVLGAAVEADYTVTFGFEKIGMRFAKRYCGNVVIPETGFFIPEDFEKRYYTYDEQDIKKLMPKRSPEANKGSFGYVLVIAGSEDMSGAAFLAAAAAYRTGCGLVKIITHENNRTALQQLLPEAILKCYGDEECPGGDEGSAIPGRDEFSRASAVIIGPGLGRSERAGLLTEAVLRNAGCPVIADADAINILAEHSEVLSETAGRRPLILTPHMLEMTRLTERNSHPSKDKITELRKDRIRIAEETAAMYSAVLILKDAATFVTDGKDGYINSTGNPAMAKGGSGDVLTGVIAGLIAQGTSPSEAARLGVYIHGRAGDRACARLGEYAVMARDIIDEI